MLDFSTRFGRHVKRRLRQEKIIWLISVDAHNTPQPRPVWFHWDGRTILIFSERNKAKLRHIARNPRVALNFNSDEDGDDVGVLVGDAKVIHEPPPERVKYFLRKYSEGIRDLEMTVGEFKNRFAVPLLVTPQAMRGFF
jgi:PPOX class probable F420-dependent enzyme